MQTEQKLIKRIKKKQDKEAANTLISYYYKEIYAYVYRQTGNEELAKDLTQDIFIQILQKIAMFDHKKASFRTWIYRIASNKIYDHYRSKTHRLSLKREPIDMTDIEGINHYFRSKIYFKDGCIAIAEGAIDREMDRYAKIVGTKGEIMIPNYNRIIDYTIHWNDGTTETKSYPFKGNDMTMQIQNFMEDVENGKVQSEKHCLEDTKKILEVSEMIAAH